jgi:16S rRNA (adenine1518-N6/adenine1519-N6)-dimethyltransferase
MNQLPVKPKKRLGQHFLVDKEVLATIIETAELQVGARVLEIGPGLGVLTAALAKAVGPDGLVLAVEADRALVDKLRERFHSKSQVKIIAGDILATPLDQLLQSPYKVVANIPYSITSPVITKFLLGDYKGRVGDQSPRPESMTMLVQLEVAERLTAKPGTRARGLLTVLIELFGEATLVRTVPPTAFEPMPQVDSAIIHLALHEPKANPWAFLMLLKAGFANKRRQFHNSLSGSLHLGTNETKELLRRVGIESSLRAEDLTIEQWLALLAAIRPESSEGEK